MAIFRPMLEIIPQLAWSISTIINGNNIVKVWLACQSRPRIATRDVHLVKVILECTNHSIDINKKNKEDDLSPLDIAIDRGHDDVSRILRDYQMKLTRPISEKKPILMRPSAISRNSFVAESSRKRFVVDSGNNNSLNVEENNACKKKELNKGSGAVISKL
jgi:hypothetical protein